MDYISTQKSEADECPDSTAGAAQNNPTHILLEDRVQQDIVGKKLPPQPMYDSLCNWPLCIWHLINCSI